jgi:hypothetical protein
MLLSPIEALSLPNSLSYQPNTTGDSCDQKPLLDNRARQTDLSRWIGLFRNASFAGNQDPAPPTDQRQRLSMTILYTTHARAGKLAEAVRLTETRSAEA